MDIKHYDVIIVGAGPTGLMLACQLSRFGIDFLLLDKKEGPTTESRALVVQARSMEIYEQMGLSDEVVKDGRPSGGVFLYKKGRKAASVYLREMGGTISPFPYVMIYEQSKNEVLLYNHLRSLGKEVQWNTEVVTTGEMEGGTAGSEGLVIEVAGGVRYSCRWLVGCDGGNSRVREWAGMPFEGGTYENVFYVADTHARGPQLSTDMLSMFPTPASMTLVFPMAGSNNFRVLGILPKEFYHRKDIRFEEIVEQVKSDLQMPIEFYDTNWYSTYRLHYKKVDRFNKGNVFFAGDAAHVHSPAGGQGMNTGLQDAYNLGWKLALVAKGKAASALLDTYHEERNPIAEALLKTTDRFFGIMTGASRLGGFLKMQVVPRVVPFFGKFSWMLRIWFGAVSQTKINYRGSSLSKGKAGKIRAGDRFPYFQVMEGGVPVPVFHLIRDANTRATPFLILLYHLPEDECGLADKELFTILSLEVNEANAEALQRVGLPRAFIALLRPDNYIGYIAEKADIGAINRFVQSAYKVSNTAFPIC